MSTVQLKDSRLTRAGDVGLEDGLRCLEGTYPTQARGWVGFNVPFSHRLTAAADMLLMPSRFEPCGLNQLYAMRYGTVPIAHATGGLRDTVVNFDPARPEGSTGFAFSPCDPEALKSATWNALQTYWYATLLVLFDSSNTCLQPRISGLTNALVQCVSTCIALTAYLRDLCKNMFRAVASASLTRLSDYFTLTHSLFFM